MRYHRSEDHSTDILGRPNDVADDDFDFTSDAIELNSNQMNESGEFETNALSDCQKYKIVMPILMKIGNLITCHSTNQLLNYSN